MKMSRKKKAFTLVELLVVIAILAVLASVSIVGYLGFTEKANKSVDEQLCTQYNILLKAESVLDKDISLSDLVILIEENGIHSNYFSTLSKEYEFAYYPDPVGENSQCVLLNSRSGDIVYPESAKTLSTDDLWCALADDIKINNNIKNYTLFKTQNFSSLGLKDGVNYNFDLNKHTVVVDVNPGTKKLNLNNGYVVYKDNTFKSKDIIVNPDNAEDVTDKKSHSTNASFALSDIKNKASLKDGILTFDEFYFFNLGSAGKEIELTCNDLTDVTQVNFNKCVFDNYKFYLNSTSRKESYTFDKCKFNNCNSYPIAEEAVNNLTITGCQFNKCDRGIKINLNRGNTIIENNIFDMNHIVLEDGKEYKDNAITLAIDGNVISNIVDGYTLKDSTSTGEYVYLGKISLCGNTIVKGTALFSLHDCCANAVDGRTTTCIEKLKNCVFTNEVFDIKENVIKDSSILLNYKNPGVVVGNNSYPSQDYVDLYNEMCTAFENLIK